MGESTYQSVKTGVGEVNIKTANTLPKTTAEKELELLQHWESHNNRKAIKVGDIKGKHSNWDLGNVTRGRGLENG